MSGFKAFCLSVLALLMFGPAGCRPAPSADDLPPLAEVNTADFVAAVAAQIDEAMAAVEAAPTDAGANGRLALTLANYGQTGAAMIAYERTRMLAPKEGRWAYAHGHLLGWSGQPEKAIEILEPAHRRQRDNFWLAYELANQYLAAGRLEESAQLCERLVSRHEDKFQAHFCAGRARLRMNDVEGAIDALTVASDMQPEVGEIEFALANAHRQKGAEDAAARHFELAQRFEERKVDAYSPVMQSMARLDRSAKPAMNRAREMFAQKRYPEAIEALEAALEIDPRRLDATAHLVLLYGRTGQTDKARQRYDAAVAGDVTDANVHLNMGMVLRRAGDTEAAVEALERAVAEDAGLARAHAELGFALEQLGRMESAKESLETAVELDPRDQNANFRLGRYYAEAGDSELALRYLEAAVVESSSATPSYLRTLAGVYTRLGRHSDAVDALTRARTLLARSGATASARGEALQVAIERDLEAARDAALLSVGGQTGG